ncbi:MAG: hypothetical protein ACO1SX_24325 [Actinomycetota bacterium]
MQPDRTTKTLLFLIAIALWGILIKSVFEPTPTTAQGLANPVRIVGVDGGALPVSILRQSVPLDVRTPLGTKLQVESAK